MWLADKAVKEQEDPEARPSSMNLAADIASDFIKKMFKLDVTAQSVTDYCGLGWKNAENAGFEWDHTVAATIMRGLGPRLMNYLQFNEFLHDYDRKISTDAPFIFLRLRRICLLSSILIAGSRKPSPQQHTA